MQNRSSIVLWLLALCGALVMGGGVDMVSDKGLTTDIPVSAPIDSDSAGKGGAVAAQSVVRIICPKEDSSGSGFLPKSGKILTAEHVVRGCSGIFLVPASGPPIRATVAAIDSEIDLALLAPASALPAASLPISTHDNFSIGTQVSTWGFPGGYFGTVPLLSVGYLSGLEAAKLPSGRIVRQWVINAAFNRGNSGGPLLLIETGEVIGVVSSKLAPISPSAKSALDALEKQQSGFTYEATWPDGSKLTVTEGQVIGMVLNELRNQVQLVIGKAVLVEDIRNFLKRHGLQP